MSRQTITVQISPLRINELSIPLVSDRVHQQRQERQTPVILDALHVHAKPRNRAARFRRQLHQGRGRKRAQRQVGRHRQVQALVRIRIYNRLFQIVLLMIYKNCTIYS